MSLLHLLMVHRPSNGHKAPRRSYPLQRVHAGEVSQPHSIRSVGISHTAMAVVIVLATCTAVLFHVNSLRRSFIKLTAGQVYMVCGM